MERQLITLQDAIQDRLARMDAEEATRREAAAKLEAQNGERLKAYADALRRRIATDTGIIFTNAEWDRVRFFEDRHDNGEVWAWAVEIPFAMYPIRPFLDSTRYRHISAKQVTDPAERLVWEAWNPQDDGEIHFVSYDFVAVAVFAQTGRKE